VEADGFECALAPATATLPESDVVAVGLPEGSHGSGESYFDRLWAKRSKAERFHIAFRKALPAIAAPREDSELCS